MSPKNEQPTGGFGNVQNSPVRHDNPKFAPPQEESIGGLIALANPSQPELVPMLPDMSAKAPPVQSPPVDDRSSEINQLSDMVKNLLSEQESLKSKLAMQEE